MMTERDILRVVRFRPYRKGMGPVFKLATWDTGNTAGGKPILGYRLTMIAPKHTSEHAREEATCGRCGRSWCDQCDPVAVSALCHWCNGRGHSKAPVNRKARSVAIFQGEDFGCSPLHAIDSDQAIQALMGFLTLRPGDTDPEYFESYTPEQLDYCAQHAEALACEVQARFGQE